MPRCCLQAKEMEEKAQRRLSEKEKAMVQAKPRAEEATPLLWLRSVIAPANV